MEFISATEMEKPRTAHELLPWVERTMDEIAKTKDGVSALRFLEGGCKQLSEEIYPLAIWAVTLDRPEHVKIEPKIGSQNHDAIVTTHDVDQPFHVEITQAHKGDQEYYRRLFLEREGWAPGPSHDVKKSGTKARGIVVEAGRTLASFEAVKRKSFELISDAIQRKLKKKYPPDIRLLVAFEDLAIAGSDDINAQLYEVIQVATQERVCPFTHIYLVGLSRKLLINWESENATR